jgi:hypothetical protein
MDKRPFWQRILRLPTFLVRAVKEAHAVVIGIISGVLFFVASLLGPWLLDKYCPALSFPHLSLLGATCLFVIVVLAVLLIGGCLTWEEEEHRHRSLQGSLAPNLTLEFEPPRDGFLYEMPGIVGGTHMNRACYVRILPATRSPVMRCRGFLESIERLERNAWVSVGFAQRPQLHWSEVHEQGITEVDIFRGNRQFLDVGYLIRGENSFHLSIDLMPFNLAPLFVQNPRGIFKFVIG